MIFKRLSAALDAGRQAAAEAPAGQKVKGQPPETHKLTWALIHFGDARTLVPRLAQHRAFCLQRGLQCLVISDDIPELCVVSREVVFEFVPWPTATALTTPGGHAAAVDHSFRRLGHVLSFWKVVGCDWEGARAADLIAMAPSWSHPLIVHARSNRGNASQPA